LIKQTRIIDPFTGEIVRDNVQHIAAAFDEEKGYLFWARKGFAKSFLDIDFPKEMSFKERGQMATLAKKMWSKTNMFGYRGRGGIRPYNVDKIGAVIGLRPYQAAAFVRKMIKVGMVALVEIRTHGITEVQYYVNPIYFFSGNRIPLNLYLIFRKQLDEVLPDWVKEKYREQNGFEGEKQK